MTRTVTLESLLDANDREIAERKAARAALEERITELQGANNREVERRRDAEASVDAITEALEAAEASCALARGEPCLCGSCIVIRGIVAFVQDQRRRQK